MIMGGCPYCDTHVSTPMGPAPCFSKEKCESCGNEYWLQHSRFNPVAYTIEGFKEEFEVNGKQIKRKDES